MTWWQVRAEFAGGGQLVFGVQTAGGEPAVWKQAGERLARFGEAPGQVTVTRIPPPGSRRLPGG